jgi:hypothetical protein
MTDWVGAPERVQAKSRITRTGTTRQAMIFRLKETGMGNEEM